MGGWVDGKGELYERQSVAVLNTIMLLTVPIAGTIQCKDVHMQCSAEICNSVVRLLIILLQLFWERKGGGDHQLQFSSLSASAQITLQTIQS